MNDRGMALITVLWIVLILSFISLSLAGATRIEVTSMQDSFDSDRAFFMAKSAAEVVFQNIQNLSALDDAPVRREAGTTIFSFDSGEARVHFESNNGLIDINEVSDKVLASMLDSLGLSELVRNELVDSILDWRDVDDVPRLYGAEMDDYGQVASSSRRRPRNAGFESIDEVLLVKNMTPDIFYGQIQGGAGSQAYGRRPGLRELITLGSGSSQVDVNHASLEVLAALPGMNRTSAAAMLSERERKPFESMPDLVARIPQLENSETMEYMTTEPGPSTRVVSVASVQPSGASRTVRLDFVRERKKQILSTVPLYYKEIEVIQFGRWRY